MYVGFGLALFSFLFVFVENEYCVNLCSSVLKAAVLIHFYTGWSEIINIRYN